MKQLKHAVKDRTGVLWVYGPGGIGKSYLTAKLACDLANANEYITVFWRFRANDANRCNRHAFFRHAIRTLGNPKFGISPTQVFPALDPTGLFKQFFDLLCAAEAKSGRKSLFILDGIDEIARSDADFVRSIFDWQVDNAVWLCAGRHEGEMIPKLFATDRCHRVFPDGLPGMTAEEIRELIDFRLGPTRFRELLQHDEDRDGRTYNRLAEAITERAAGLPLYVHFLCEDLLVGKLPLNAGLLDQLPRGLEAYFEVLLKRLEMDDDESATLGLLVALCAWAIEPVDETTLLELLARREVLIRDEHSRSVLRNALQRISTILRIVLRSDGEIGYEPYHSTLRDFIQADQKRRIQNHFARGVFANLRWTGRSCRRAHPFVMPCGTVRSTCSANRSGTTSTPSRQAKNS